VTTVPAGTVSAPAITTTGDTNTGIYFPAADTIAFTEGGVESMRIDSSGNVGIGTATPAYKFDLVGQSRVTMGGSPFAFLMRYDSSSAPFIIGSPSANAMSFSNSDGTERARIASGGSFYTFGGNPLITGTPSAADASTANAIFQGRYSATSTTGGGTSCIFITSNGNLYNTNGTYGTLSDAKLKENIVDATSQWNDIKALRVRNFNFKEGQTHTQIGYIAQEVEAVSPSLVDTSQDVDAEGNELGTTTKSLKLSVINIKAVKALQENMVRTESLETLIQEQQALITQLQADVAALKGASA
jgi:hypothetical protein